MLYDPKWEQQTKADLFKIETLIAWLEKQPAETVYCWHNSRTCLIAQYMHAHGVSQPPVALDGWMADVAYGYEPYQTFGEALDRARAAANQ